MAPAANASSVRAGCVAALLFAHTSIMKDVPMNSLQAAGFPFAYTDLTKAWVNFELPFLPTSALSEAHRKNAAALTNASQVVVECLQTLAQRQAQLFKSTIDDYSKVTRDVLAGTSFEERVTNQADISRHFVGHLRELSDIAVKANVTAIDILNGRITEAFEELKSVFAEPLAPNSVAPTEVIGEHIAMVEHAASGGDVVGQDEPEPTVKIRTRKKAAPAAKAVRRRTSRR
jgi:phasin family protein